MLETIVGFVALGISIFAVAISMVFYFKSDNLYKEMLKIISEIKVFSERTYSDTFGMVKEAWPHIWEKSDKEKENIKQESNEKIKQIKEEVTTEMKQEVEKIKKLDLESVKKDQFQKEIGRLEQMFSKLFDETSRRIAEAERERERKIVEQPEAAIDETRLNTHILDMLATSVGKRAQAYTIVGTIARRLKIEDRHVIDALSSLRELGRLDYVGSLRPTTVISLKS